MITINVPIDENEDIPYLNIFSSRRISNEIRQKKKIQFNLDNNTMANKEKLDLVRHEAKRLKYTNDTNEVIVAKLNDSTVYSVIVGLMNICHEDGHKTHALFDRQFVIFGEPAYKKPKPEPMYCCFMGNDLIIIEPKKSFREKLEILIQPFSIAQVGGLLFVWIIMTLSAFMHFKRIRKLD